MDTLSEMNAITFSMQLVAFVATLAIRLLKTIVHFLFTFFSFKLFGSSIRLCLPSGKWSGDQPSCKVKTCRPMKPPNNGYVSCTTRNYQVDTICEFGCNFGYRLLGSKKRMCLPISLWGGLPAYCKRKFDYI